MASNNPPEVVVPMTRKQAEFVIRNCDSNIRLGIGMLEGVNKATGLQIVELIENFKAVKAATEKALRE